MAIRIATNITSLQGQTVHLGGVMRIATGKMVDDPITPTTLINNPDCVVADGTHVDYILDSPMVFLTPGDPFYDITPGVIIDNTEFSETDINTIYNSGGYIRSTFNKQQNKFIATAHHGTQALSLLLDNPDTITNVVNNAGGITPSISTFIELNDTPSTYTGQAGKVVAVNTSEDGVEFITPSSGGSGAIEEENLGGVLLPTDLGNSNSTTIDKGIGSLVLGGANDNNINYSVVQGFSGVNQIPGYSNVCMLGQTNHTLFYNETTGTVASELLSFDGLIGIPIPEDTVINLDITVDAIRTDLSTQYKRMQLTGIVRNLGGSLSLSQYTNTDIWDTHGTLSSSIQLDTVNNKFYIQVQNTTSGETIRWIANCKFTLIKLT